MFIELLGIYTQPHNVRALRFFRVHYASQEDVKDIIRLFHDTVVTLGDRFYVADAGIDVPNYTHHSDLKEYGLNYKRLVLLRPVALWSL